MPNIIIKLLDSEEYEKVSHVFHEQGVNAPAPELSWIAAAEDENGNIIAFFTLQPIIHGEPLWVHPNHAGEGLAGMVIQKINQLKIQYYSFAPDDRVAHICKMNSMVELPWRVFVKSFSQQDL